MIAVVLTRNLLLKRRKLTFCLLFAVFCLFLLSFTGNSAFRDGRFYSFSLKPLKTPMEAGERRGRSNASPKPRFFQQVTGHNIFLYSAIANHREPVMGELNIIITAFDSTETDSLQCCVVLGDGLLFATKSIIYHKYYIFPNFLGPVVEKFRDAKTRAKQYACIVPELGFNVSHVTLTSASCPIAEEDYLPVIFPQQVPQGLALCAKAAFGNELDPNKLMEWFEVQLLLGVDHIQLMDIDNPEPIQRVFRYYKEMGLLNLLPFELPGPPYHRGLDKAHWVPQQALHDEQFAILDCTQRLRGYSYVVGYDMDEVIVPAKHMTIKELLQEQFTKKPDAAGFYFMTQFFIYDWGPTDPKANITFLAYFISSLPRNERRKYAYLMNRMAHARTHDFYPRSSYQAYYVPVEDATLHHYRKCKGTWSSKPNECERTAKTTDRSFLRFKSQLEERVKIARRNIGIGPSTV